MSSLYARLTSIISLAAAASLVGKEGYFYKLDGANKAVICSAVTDIPHGLIGDVSEDGLRISALPLGGNHGTVRVKLGAAVTDLRKDLTLRADATAESDDGAGARVIVARPLETGAADEMIECALLPARLIGTGIVVGSTDGTAAGAADLAALKAETELLGDDVRALYTALKTAGVIG